MRWFISQNGVTDGPFEEFVVRDWQKAGQLGQTAMFQREGFDEWIPLAQSPFATGSISTKGLGWFAGIAVAGLLSCGFWAAILSSKDKRDPKRDAEYIARVREENKQKLERDEAEDRARRSGSGTTGSASNCTLSVPGSSGPVVVFPTEEGYDEFGKAAASGNSSAADITARAHGGFLVKRGSACFIIEYGLLGSQIRVLEGPHEGRDGWVPPEWMRGK